MMEFFSRGKRAGARTYRQEVLQRFLGSRWPLSRSTNFAGWLARVGALRHFAVSSPTAPSRWSSTTLTLRSHDSGEQLFRGDKQTASTITIQTKRTVVAVFVAIHSLFLLAFNKNDSATCHILETKAVYAP